MVDGGDQGEPGALHAQQPVAERLVVVHDVELAAPGGQVAAGAQREGQGFREAAGPHGGDFEGVDPVAVLAAARRAEGVGLAVQVEAGQLGEGDALAGVEDRIGLGPDDLDAVAEAGEFAGEVAYVHALAAAVRVALVGEQRDAQRPVVVPAQEARRSRLCGLSGHSRPPSHAVQPERNR